MPQVGRCPSNCRREAAGPCSVVRGATAQAGRQGRRQGAARRPPPASQETCHRRAPRKLGARHPHGRAGCTGRRRPDAMTIAGNLGYPRIGPRRELKTALEAFWAGRAGETDSWLRPGPCGPAAADCSRAAASATSPRPTLPSTTMSWRPPAPSAPSRRATAGPARGRPSLATLFALARGARGTEAERAAGITPDAAALEMTKWFDTNYHYLVPRLSARTRFRLVDDRWTGAVREGLQHGTRTRPVLLGPVTFLLLSKAEDGTRPLRPPALPPARLRRGPARHGRGRRDVGAGGRAMPRHRPAGWRRRGLSRRPSTRWRTRRPASTSC